MKTYCVLLFALLLGLITGCDSPTDSFERVNKNDPLSRAFTGGPVTELQVSADTSGAITIQWGESNNVVTKNVIEKSLGDTMSFTPIAELDADAVKYVDASLEVRKNTYYRVSSFVEIEEKDDVLYGRDQAQLSFGLIENDRFDFLEDSNRLQLSWSVDVPFYTHFIITSENVLTEQQENSVKIPSGKIKNMFEDPLFDIDFETRKYDIAGIIEHDGVDEVIVEKELSFDAASFFKPENVEINILNEQDWEVSWEGDVFFATEVEVTRFNLYGDIVHNFSVGVNSFIDSLIVKDGELSSNQARNYSVKFLSENRSSKSVVKGDDIEILPLNLYGVSSILNDQNSLELRWSKSNGYMFMKEIIIEKETSSGGISDFQEIARIDASAFGYTLSNLNPEDFLRFRLRTLTTDYTEPMSVIFSHEYEMEYSLNTSMRDITSVEVTSDQNYLVATSPSPNRFGSENHPIYIWDLNSRQLMQSIEAGSELITDFKISPDENHIYYTVPSEGAIYKADFPSGHNKLKIIDDAKVNLEGVRHIDVSSDGTFLVGTGGHGFVKRWNLDTYDPVFLLSEYNSPTPFLHKNVAISPDGSMIGSNNGSSLILDAQNGSIIETLPGAANMIDLQFSSDGLYYANVSEFNSVDIFSTETWELIDNTTARRATFHPENSTLAVGGFSNVFIYDLIGKKPVDVISDQINGTEAYATDQDKITFIGNDRLAIVDTGQWINVWKKTTNKRWKKFD